jgi:hypothetical protein
MCVKKFQKNNKENKLMKIRPIGNRVVLKAIDKNKSINGIIIPDTVSEKPTYF